MLEANDTGAKVAHMRWKIVEVCVLEQVELTWQQLVEWQTFNMCA